MARGGGRVDLRMVDERSTIRKDTDDRSLTYRSGRRATGESGWRATTFGRGQLGSIHNHPKRTLYVFP